MPIFMSVFTPTFIAFGLFGLINNILYVVILSAAVDLVGSSTPKALVLLTDIIPAFLVKLIAPFVFEWIPYTTRLWMLVGLSVGGMLIIALSGETDVSTKIFGILFASLSSGIGEVTFLQLTHFYDEKQAIGGFSTGTGGAGLLGSFVFLLLTNILRLEVWVSLLMFAIVPFGLAVTYFVVLPKLQSYSRLPGDPDGSVQNCSFRPQNENRTRNLQGHVSATLAKIRPLVTPYMVPLFTVYVSEYVINQGIAPTLTFDLGELPAWLFKSNRDIYVVYGFLYQLGVFVSRSSINFGYRFRHLYRMSLLQLLNVGICICQSVWEVPLLSIWLVCVLVFYEGLLGGLLYANTFLSVSEEVPKDRREFSMGAVGVSDSFGIVVAGCINFWLEGMLCYWQRQQGKDWCETK